MAKRNKRLEKGIESLKKEIEKHFNKLNEEITEKNMILAEYHAKEIDKSLITALEHKISLLSKNTINIELIKKYKALLEEYKNKLDIG